MALNKGALAPDFSLPSTSGSNFHLYSELKEGPIIVFFYPKDFTGVCTKEVCMFRDEFSAFKDFSVPVIGISRDSLETHQKFISTYSLPFHLLSDESGSVCKSYDALVPILRIPKRITYLVGKDKNILSYVQDFGSHESHIREMLLQLENIK